MKRPKCPRCKGFNVRRIGYGTPFKVMDGKKYSKRVTGYYAKTSGDREYMHRDVLGVKGKKVVHHKDNKKDHNVPRNLQVMTVRKHGGIK